MYILSSSMHQEQLEVPFALPDAWLNQHQAVAILTGGTEEQFRSLCEAGHIRLNEPVYLLASTHSNSLAASLEILSWIRQQGGDGRVLTSPHDIEEASVQKETVSASDTVPCHPFASVREALRGQRLGVIGRPSDWLIASEVNYRQVLEETGLELIDIPIEEVSSLGKIEDGVTGAERITERLRELVKKYALNGLTLRCFDLLSTVHNTGCMALAHLNDEGIPASCEGDIPLLLTMMLAKQRFGKPGFQVNPAEIHPDGTMLWAHCTVPFSMTTSHSLTTHFESGIGVGIHGELPTGTYWLMKLSNNLHTLLCEKVELTGNQFAPNLCRTQVWLKGSPALAEQLLSYPIANHHLLVKE